MWVSVVIFNLLLLLFVVFLRACMLQLTKLGVLNRKALTYIDLLSIVSYVDRQIYLVHTEVAKRQAFHFPASI